jgi:rhodanese-related sulfurtransferase
MLGSRFEIQGAPLIPSPLSEIEQVPAAEWRAWITQNEGVLLDVREPMEWAGGTLPDSTKISLAFLPGSLGELDPETPVLVVCRAGNRSMLAAQFLKRNGFKNAANLFGGLTSIGLA